MASPKEYDANEVTCNFSLFPIESGYADGEFIRIEQDNDSFSAVQGTDGEVTRSKTNQDLTTVTIILMQSSDGQAILSTIHNADKISGNGAGIGPLMIRDRQGLSVFEADAWIKGPPKVSYDRGATGREWSLHCTNVVRFDGGN